MISFQDMPRDLPCQASVLSLRPVFFRRPLPPAPLGSSQRSVTSCEVRLFILAFPRDLTRANPVRDLRISELTRWSCSPAVSAALKYVRR